jgi:phenylacetate-coenzyme A ligase PaaK-like adenylate-forming protein
MHAYRHHPFYRDLMSQAHFNPKTIRDTQELSQLPIVDRRMYREFIEAELNCHPKRYQTYFKDATSGSTGLPLRVYRNWFERGYMLAKFLRVAIRNGYRPVDRTLWFASPKHVRQRDTFLQRMGIMRRAVISFSEPTERLVQAYVRFRPDMLYANKSHLVQLALFAKKHGIELKPPRLCVSTGEVLDGVSRAVIEEVFGKQSLLDYYGAVEFSSLAYRRVAKHAHYFFSHDTDMVELTNRDPLNPNVGTALFTDLHISSFPLIRYSPGDRLEVETDGDLPVIKRVIGRDDHLLIFRDGTTCGGPIIEVIMETYPSIVQYRVIQEDKTNVRVLIVTRNGTDHDTLRRQLISQFVQQVNPMMDYVFEFVAMIPPDPNGKLRMLISKVDKNQE